jgi:diguanylate cyclase (GGDEF)-like protein
MAVNIVESRLQSKADEIVAPAPISLAGPSFEHIEGRGLEQALALVGRLQTTLDLSRLLEIFSPELAKSVPHAGMALRNDAEGVDMEIGTRAQHSASYRLMLADQSLGELVFWRSRRFSNDEALRIEYLLCALVHPLRNALLYRAALRSAHTDPLTGTYNRAALDSTLKRELDLARRNGTPFSVILLDVDHFKQINDTHGHAAGDNVLRELARCLMRTVRGTDMIYRYGGEEFVVLLNNTGINGALLLAERIRRNVAALDCLCEGACLHITVSAGVGTLDADDSETSLIEHADRALYEAKGSGRNCVRYLGTR